MQKTLLCYKWVCLVIDYSIYKYRCCANSANWKVSSFVLLHGSYFCFVQESSNTCLRMGELTTSSQTFTSRGSQNVWMKFSQDMSPNSIMQVESLLNIYLATIKWTDKKPIARFSFLLTSVNEPTLKFIIFAETSLLIFFLISWWGFCRYRLWNKLVT